MCMAPKLGFRAKGGGEGSGELRRLSDELTNYPINSLTHWLISHLSTKSIDTRIERRCAAYLGAAGGGPLAAIAWGYGQRTKRRRVNVLCAELVVEVLGPRQAGPDFEGRPSRHELASRATWGGVERPTGRANRFIRHTGGKRSDDRRTDRSIDRSIARSISREIGREIARASLFNGGRLCCRIVEASVVDTFSQEYPRKHILDQCDLRTSSWAFTREFFPHSACKELVLLHKQGPLGVNLLCSARLAVYTASGVESRLYKNGALKQQNAVKADQGTNTALVSFFLSKHRSGSIA